MARSNAAEATPLEELDFETKARVEAMRAVWAEDYELFAREKLHVYDRDHPLGGRFIKFVFNPLQKALHETISKIEEFNLLVSRMAANDDPNVIVSPYPIKLVILKARKGGCSTYLVGRNFWRGEFRSGHKGLVMAHEKPAAQNIAEIASPFHYQWEDSDGFSTRRAIARFTGNDIAWAPRYQSKVVTKTAGSRKGSSRSYTYNFVHISEEAHFDVSDEVASALNASVAFSEKYEESTANGEGNLFYESWRKAIDVDDALERLRAGRPMPSGWNGKFRFFWAWHQDPGYRRALLPGERERMERSLDEEEKELIERFRVSFEQLAWRRDKIAGDCSDQGEMDPLDYFHQEYPSDPEEAFVARGKTVFDQKKCQRQREAAEQELEAGNVACYRLRRITEGADFELVKLKNPRAATFFMYEGPAAGEQYIIGGDAAEGLEHGDWTTCTVWARRDGTFMEEVARFIAKVAAEELGEVMVWLAKMYNNAFLIPEGRYPGNATCNRIVSLGYFNIYQRKNPDVVGEQAEKENFILGFVTAAGKKGNSKALIVELAVRMWRDSKILLRTVEAIRQWKIFQQLDGGYGAPDGENDDCVMADLFAVYAQFTPGVAPYFEFLDKKKEAEPVDESPITQRDLDLDWHMKAKESKAKYAERAMLEERRKNERQNRAMGRWKPRVRASAYD